MVATDFSTAADHAIARALLLPLAQRARITLVHVVGTSLLPALFSTARTDAQAELDRVGAEITARAAPRGLDVQTRLRNGTPYAEITRVAREEQADLVVLGRVGRSPLRDHFIGSTAEQVVRNGDRSVLLVRTPANGPYVRPVCSVDIGEAAADVLRFTLRVVSDVSVRVIHIYDAPFEGMFLRSLSTESVTEYRHEYRDRAKAELDALLSNLGEPRKRWRLVLRHGSPRSRVPAAVSRSRADLLVMGTHAHRGPTFALLGSVAGDVLRSVSCDTLMVRPDVKLQQA